MKTYKNALTIRGDCLYCPLPFSLDAYWNCLINCHHCYFRHLNHTWGTDLRPSDPSEVYKRLKNGLKNPKPSSYIAHAMKQQKTLRFGNKTDPFQPIERKHKVSLRLIKVLNKLNWTYVIQTRCTKLMMEYEKWLNISISRNLLTVMPVISPGLSKDWEILEKTLTTKPSKRLKHLAKLSKMGANVGVNGEPFIPGYHTPKDFEKTLKLLKKYGIKSYNTYNFHFNAFVAKRLHAIGIDIEKIWYYNRDEYWKPILQELLDISKKHNIILGCPDFVNTGSNWYEKTNTCCGINVPNPCTYNSHHWKGMLQEGRNPKDILKETYDGVGNEEQAEAIVYGKKSEFYTMKDAGML